MTTGFPDLHQTKLQYVSLCLYVDAGDELADELTCDLGAVQIECEPTLNGHDHRLNLQIEPPDDDDEVHVHVNFARLSYIDPFELPPIAGSLADVDRALEQLGGAHGRLACFGHYQIDMGDLPKEGLIARLGGISLKTGKLELSLSGGELSIKGSVFNRIQWSIRKNLVTGVLSTAPTSATVSSRYIEEAVKTLDDGVRSYVLHVTDDMDT